MDDSMKKKMLNELLESVEHYVVDLTVMISHTARDGSPYSLQPVTESRKKLLEVLDKMGLLV